MRSCVRRWERLLPRTRGRLPAHALPGPPAAWETSGAPAWLGPGNHTRLRTAGVSPLTLPCQAVCAKASHPFYGTRREPHALACVPGVRHGRRRARWGCGPHRGPSFLVTWSRVWKQQSVRSPELARRTQNKASQRKQEKRHSHRRNVTEKCKVAHVAHALSRRDLNAAFPSEERQTLSERRVLWAGGSVPGSPPANPPSTPPNRGRRSDRSGIHWAEVSPEYLRLRS